MRQWTASLFDQVMARRLLGAESLLEPILPHYQFDPLGFILVIYAAPGGDGLTRLPLVPHICVSESGQHWFR